MYSFPKIVVREMLPSINPPYIRKRWEGGDDGGGGGDGDAAADVTVKSLASGQIKVKTESKSKVARPVTAPLVTR